MEIRRGNRSTTRAKRRMNLWFHFWLCDTLTVWDIESDSRNQTQRYIASHICFRDFSKTSERTRGERIENDEKMEDDVVYRRQTSHHKNQCKRIARSLITTNTSLLPLRLFFVSSSFLLTLSGPIQFPFLHFICPSSWWCLGTLFFVYVWISFWAKHSSKCSICLDIVPWIWNVQYQINGHIAMAYYRMWICAKVAFHTHIQIKADKLKAMCNIVSRSGKLHHIPAWIERLTE